MTAGGLVDVAGLRIGHHTATTDGYLTGTTVVLGPPEGMVAGVDVRGGAPGTRETDLLAPTAAMDRVHALVLTGGSAYGLAAADGVARVLGERGIGFPVGAQPSYVVPIVPAAVIFDLARGGDFMALPDASFGRAAAERALAEVPADAYAEGLIGAGTGACTGRLKGGIGQAATVLEDGTTVSTLVVANATGSAFDPATGELWATRLFDDTADPRPLPPSAADLVVLRRHADSIRALLDAGSRGATASIRHTTLGIVATDATLTKVQATKLAAIAHDGLARAVNPVHTMFDGDLFFGVSTERRPAPDAAQFYRILAAAADVVTRALGRAVLAATGVTTPGGSWPSYLDLAPSAQPVIPENTEDSDDTDNRG